MKEVGNDGARVRGKLGIHGNDEAGARDIGGSFEGLTPQRHGGARHRTKEFGNHGCEVEINEDLASRIHGDSSTDGGSIG